MTSHPVNTLTIILKSKFGDPLERILPKDIVSERDIKSLRAPEEMWTKVGFSNLLDRTVTTGLAINFPLAPPKYFLPCMFTDS